MPVRGYVDGVVETTHVKGGQHHSLGLAQLAGASKPSTSMCCSLLAHCWLANQLHQVPAARACHLMDYIFKLGAFVP